VEVSSGFVWADVDAAGQGTGLSAMLGVDVIASSVLTTNIRNTVSGLEGVSGTVYQASSGWGTAGAIDSNLSGGWESTKNSVSSTTDGSAFWISGYNYSLSAWDTVKDNSGTTWIAGGGASLEASVIALNVFSGSVDSSTTVLDASVGALNVFSGSVDSSTTVLDASVGALNVFSGSVDSSTVVLDASVDALNVFSGSVETSTTSIDARITGLDTSVHALNVFSGSVEVSTDAIDGRITGLDTSVHALNVFSGSVEVSTDAIDGRVTGLDTSVHALNVFSGSVEVSTDAIDGRVTAVELEVPSATGYVDWNDTATWADVSSTKSIGGSTPTLSNDLDANGNSIRGANLSVCSTTGDLTLSAVGDIRIGAQKYIKSQDSGNLLLSGTNAYLLGFDNLKIGTTIAAASAWNETEIGKSGSGYDYALSAWTTVKDTSSSWGGGGGSYEACAIASAIYVGVPAGSAIDLSGADGDTIDEVGDGNILSIDSAAARVKWVKPAFGPVGFDNIINLGAGVGSDATLSVGAATMLIRDVHVGGDLSSTVDATVQLDSSTITVSSCPVPPPWSFVMLTAAANVTTSQDYYFGMSGSTKTITESDVQHITWNDTLAVFTIANAGFYEFEMQGSVIVNTSPTTITTTIVETDFLGGTEVSKNVKNQLVRANIDPHDIMLKWVGYVAAGKNYTCKFNSGSGVAVNTLQKGSTFTCKRIN